MENVEKKLEGQTPSKGYAKKLAAERHLMEVNHIRLTSVCIVDPPCHRIQFHGSFTPSQNRVAIPIISS